MDGEPRQRAQDVALFTDETTSAVADYDDEEIPVTSALKTAGDPPSAGAES
jgi:hypothetical protein